MHRNTKNTKHWRLSWFRYETFITFFKFRFSTQGERGTIFTMLTVSSDPTNARAQPAANNWTGLAQVRKIKSLRLSPNLNSQLLFKITENPSRSLPGMTSLTFPVLFPIWGFYCDICDCHILPPRAWTPALMSAPTHALSQKVLSRTKPKDKIYKTKNDNIKKILPQFYNIYIYILIYHIFLINRLLDWF